MKRIASVVVALSMLNTACYKRVEIPREELTNHAVFSEKGSTYQLKLNETGAPPPLNSFRVEDDTLIGSLRGGATGAPSFPLASVEKVEKRTFSPGRTTAWVLGILVGAVGIWVAGMAAVYAGNGED